MIAFGDMAGDEKRSLAVGHRVAEALSLAGFRVSWDGSDTTRISIPLFDWKRRHA